MAKRARREPYRVFLSYSHADRWVAHQLVRIIEGESRRRVEVFLDERRIEGGEQVAESVRKAIVDCDEFIVLLTPSSKDREWVHNEIGAAWVLQKRIVAVVDKVTPRKVPEIIRASKAVDLNEFDEYVQQLVKRAGVGRP